MTALPAVTEFTDNDMAAIRFSDAVAAMRDFLAGILGTDGTQAGALAALYAPLAR